MMIKSIRLTFVLLISSIFTIFISYSQVAEWVVSNPGIGQDVCMDQFNNSFGSSQIVGNTNIGSYSFIGAGLQDVAVVKYDPSGTILWATAFGGPQGDFIHKIVYDGFGGVWVTGQFEGTMNVGSFTLTSAGGVDAFLVKIDASSGAIVYAERVGNTGEDVGMSVNVDPLGNVYFSGIFHSNFSYGSVSIAAQGSYEVFLVKLTNSGVPIWAKGITGTSTETMWSMTVDNQGNSIIAGMSSSTTTNFGGSTQSLSGGSVFITKFDTNGNFIWISPPITSEEIDDICTDGAGNIFFTGNFSGPANFGGIALTTNGLDDISVGKLNSSGAFMWANSYGGGGNDEGYGIVCTSQGDAILTGDFQGIVTIGSTTINSGGNTKSFTTKINSLGSPVWTVESTGGSLHIATGITINNNDDIFLTGWGSGTYSMGGATNTLDPGYIVKLADNANIIEGTVFSDANNDGVLDVGEVGIPNVIVQLNGGPSVTASNNMGIYNMYTFSGNQSVSIPNLPLYHTLSTPPTLSFNFVGMGTIDTSNYFGLVPTPNMNDLKVDITPLTSPKAGHVLTYVLTYKNQGTTTQNGTVTLQASPLLTYIGANPSITTMNGQTFSWNLGTLVPQQSGTIFIQLNIPNNSNIGDLIQSTVDISPVLNDETPNDNSQTSTCAVTGPYDPNYKEVNIDTLYDITSSDWLEYVIHFQNIGTDVAENVIIIDSLSAYLDLSSMEILATSHSGLNFYINHGNVAEFRFNNIMLPDSLSDPIGSNGFVKFRVKYLSTLPLFSSITNFADIYFDYNDAIRTDTAVTYHSTISLSVNEVAGLENLSVYPNPTNDLLHFSFNKETNANAQVRLYSLTGALLINQPINDMNSTVHSTINLGELTQGIYFIEFFDGSNTEVVKVIKK